MGGDGWFPRTCFGKPIAIAKQVHVQEICAPRGSLRQPVNANIMH
jgi:hypothetical protein